MNDWKRALPALATVVIAALAALAVVLLTRGDASAEPARAEAPGATSDAPAPSTPAESTPSASPSAAPSSTEPSPADSAAPAPVTTSSSPAPKPKATKVVVTVAYHGWSWIDEIAQVGGLVEGVKKKGGTCTVTMTRDGRSVTGTASATTDEKGGVVCEAVTVDSAELNAGMWKAVLSYTGAATTGSSAAVDIEVVK